MIYYFFRRFFNIQRTIRQAWYVMFIPVNILTYNLVIKHFAFPFKIGIDGTRTEVIEKYRQWLYTQEELITSIPELRRKRLGCYCHPKACHGDVLAELANCSMEMDLL